MNVKTLGAVKAIEHVTQLLAKGAVAVLVNPNIPEVDLPEDILAAGKAPGAVILNFSHAFSPDDLVVDDFGISQTLSFGMTLYPCKIPWKAVIRYRGGAAKVATPISPQQQPEGKLAN